MRCTSSARVGAASETHARTHARAHEHLRTRTHAHARAVPIPDPGLRVDLWPPLCQKARPSSVWKLGQRP
eukprot:13079885-Alexandrium_andersonii.AAC.1